MERGAGDVNCFKKLRVTACGQKHIKFSPQLLYCTVFPPPRQGRSTLPGTRWLGRGEELLRSLGVGGVGGLLG